MADSIFVRGFERVGQLLGDCQHRLGAEMSAAIENGSQRRALHVLHGEGEIGSGFSQIVRAHYVAVCDAPSEANLVSEAFDRGFVFSEYVGAERLYRDPLV